jgi:hypothetical protein
LFCPIVLPRSLPCVEVAVESVNHFSQVAQHHARCVPLVYVARPVYVAHLWARVLPLALPVLAAGQVSQLIVAHPIAAMAHL